MVEEQVALATQNLVNVERCQIQIVTFHPMVLWMSNDACIMTGINATSLVIDNGVQRILGGRSIHCVLAVLRFRQEWSQIELIGEWNERGNLFLVILKKNSLATSHTKSSRTTYQPCLLESFQMKTCNNWQRFNAQFLRELLFGVAFWAN